MANKAIFNDYYYVNHFAGMDSANQKKEHCMLTEKTVGLIRQILEMDSEVTETEKEQIMKACKMRPQRKLVSAKVAMQTL